MLLATGGGPHWRCVEAGESADRSAHERNADEPGAAGLGCLARQHGGLGFHVCRGMLRESGGLQGGQNCPALHSLLDAAERSFAHAVAHSRKPRGQNRRRCLHPGGAVAAKI